MLLVAEMTARAAAEVVGVQANVPFAIKDLHSLSTRVPRQKADSTRLTSLCCFKRSQISTESGGVIGLIKIIWLCFLVFKIGNITFVFTFINADIFYKTTYLRTKLSRLCHSIGINFSINGV